MQIGWNTRSWTAREITNIVGLFEREEADMCLSRERKERREAGKIGSADSVSGSVLLWRQGVV